MKQFYVLSPFAVPDYLFEMTCEKELKVLFSVLSLILKSLHISHVCCRIVNNAIKIKESCSHCEFVCVQG